MTPSVDVVGIALIVEYVMLFETLELCCLAMMCVVCVFCHSQEARMMVLGKINEPDLLRVSIASLYHLVGTSLKAQTVYCVACFCIFDDFSSLSSFIGVQCSASILCGQWMLYR